MLSKKSVRIGVVIRTKDSELKTMLAGEVEIDMSYFIDQKMAKCAFREKVSKSSVERVLRFLSYLPSLGTTYSMGEYSITQAYHFDYDHKKAGKK